MGFNFRKFTVEKNGILMYVIGETGANDDLHMEYS